MAKIHTVLPRNVDNGSSAVTKNFAVEFTKLNVKAFSYFQVQTA